VFASSLPVTAKHWPTVCLRRPSICQRLLACDIQAFANSLLVTAEQQFAYDGQASAHNLPVMAIHLPTANGLPV
jgi:hypothetical protein